MKKEDIFAKIRVFLAPVLVILLGLTLLFNPDSASALISRIIGGVLGLIAIGFGISAIASSQGRAGKVEMKNGVIALTHLQTLEEDTFGRALPFWLFWRA